MKSKILTLNFDEGSGRQSRALWDFIANHKKFSHSLPDCDIILL